MFKFPLKVKKGEYTVPVPLFLSLVQIQVSLLPLYHYP